MIKFFKGIRAMIRVFYRNIVAAKEKKRVEALGIAFCTKKAAYWCLGYGDGLEFCRESICQKGVDVTKQPCQCGKIKPAAKK